MKILLVGHSIIDHIEKYSDQDIKPGGVFYSVLGILSCLKNDDSAYLLTSLSNTYAELFSVTYNNVNLSLSKISDSMPEVILKVYEKSEREEIYRNISEPLDITSLKTFDQPDGILINMITGFDITPEQLKWMRSIFSCPIYFDVHTLSRGLDMNMKRSFRLIPDIQAWLINIDILQCNENELNSITQIRPIEIAAKFILSNGVKILLLTRAEKGSEAFFFDGNILKRIVVEAETVETKNKIGCGDIFGAVFFYSYISMQDVAYSLTLANKAGAIAASSENLTTFSKLTLK